MPVKKSIRKNERTVVTVISVSAVLVIWQCVSVAMNIPVIFPSPVTVVKSFTEILFRKNFVTDVLFTVLRAFESFIVIVLSGTVTGIVAGYFRIVEFALNPLMYIFKATPVMSVILLAFIWFRTGTVPVFSAFLMAFPVMYVQVLNGVRGLDEQLVQMCDVYNIRGWKRLRHFTVPALIPSIITGARQSLSMIWKVVIAAEVLTLPSHGVGRSMQLAQIQLETEKVFAWTAVAVLLTVTGDFLFDTAIRKITQRRIGK
ncbi:MAG: ABC transporter permease subunit [Sphaerochaetaceae bacterium]|nr:ABC transporter permease subunit [Sphaerochaetaceae bacterium]